MRVGGVHEFVFVPWDIYLELRHCSWPPKGIACVSQLAFRGLRVSPSTGECLTPLVLTPW